MGLVPNAAGTYVGGTELSLTLDGSTATVNIFGLSGTETGNLNGRKCEGLALSVLPAPPAM